MTSRERERDIAAIGAEPDPSWVSMGLMMLANPWIIHAVVAKLPNPMNEGDAHDRLAALHAWLASCQHPQVMLLQQKSDDAGHRALAVACEDRAQGMSNMRMEIVDCTLPGKIPAADSREIEEFQQVDTPDRLQLISARQRTEDQGGCRPWLDLIQQAEQCVMEEHPGALVVRAFAKHIAPTNHVDETGNWVYREEHVHWDATYDYLRQPFASRMASEDNSMTEALLACRPPDIAQLEWIERVNINTRFHRATKEHVATLQARHLQNRTPETISLQRGIRL